ncbi:hypothetical protein LTR64_002795 [Lithohypha guttulata]|uniref:Uncharacterized protein n=2 Tax=Lithohypha guttulata TaxID=1690604 RepID=A0AAN7T149_9EURO|nr:hypothetical protein LTR24_009678 [Lithohypha guttulata]KAK5085985.1 hypothetical protein LTR05_005275 [Lithohypha guttulata]
MEHRNPRPHTHLYDWDWTDAPEAGNDITSKEDGIQADHPAQPLDANAIRSEEEPVTRKVITEPCENVRGERSQTLSPTKSLVSSARPTSLPGIKTQSPWSLYDKCYELDFGEGFMWIVRKKVGARTLFLMHQTSDVDLEILSESFRKARSPYFVKCFDILQTGSDTNIILEFMNMSLVQVIGAPRPVTEQEVRSIVGQLTKGLLEAEHARAPGSHLDLSRIWLNLNGDVKILPQIVEVGRSRNLDAAQKRVHSLGSIIQKLVAKTNRPDLSSNAGPGHYSRDLLDFMGETTTGDVKTLLKLA